MVTFKATHSLLNTPLFEGMTHLSREQVLSEVDVRIITQDDPLLLTYPPEMHYLIPLTNNLVLYRNTSHRFGLRIPSGVLWPIRLQPDVSMEVRSIPTDKYNDNTGAVGLVPEATIGRWMMEYPTLRVTILQAIANSDKLLIDEIEQYACNALTGRVARFLLDLNDVAEQGAVYYRQAEIAEILNAQRESISIILGRFRKAQWINTRYGMVQVIDTEALGRIANAY